MKLYKRIFTEHENKNEDLELTTGKYNPILDFPSNVISSNAKVANPVKDGKIIPVTAVFRRGYGFPGSLRDFIGNMYTFEHNSDQDQWNAMWDEMPVKRIPVHLIIPTQHNLDVRRIPDERVASDVPKAHFICVNGFYYLIDGHHRVAGMIRNGQQVKGKILHFKIPGKITLGR